MSEQYFAKKPGCESRPVAFETECVGVRDRLSPGGRLYVVIRKQQGAPSALRHMQELYASARVIAREKGFWVIECEGKKEDI